MREPSHKKAESPTITEAEARVLERLDLGYLRECLRDLVRVPSLGGTRDEVRAQETMAELLGDLGMEVDTWSIDFESLRRHPRYSAEIDRRQGLGVVGTWSPGESSGERDGRHLVLNGHVDVVPLGDREQWTRSPWDCEEEDGRIFGRGTCDMKGGLACALAAVRAVRDAGVPLPGQVSIHSVVGEEDGGCGTLATLERGHGGDGAVVMEPTRRAVVPAQAGALNFRLTVHGRAAHGCVRDEGRSAIENFFPVFQALRELETRRNARGAPLFEDYRLPWPLSVGTLQAGDWPSSVPDRLTCEGRLGVAVGEELDHARRDFERAVAEAAAADPHLRDRPPTVEWWGGRFEPAVTDGDDPVVTTLCGAIEDLEGRPPSLEGVPYGADMRLLVLEGGIPTVLFGPGDVRRAHRPDEFVPVNDLEHVASTLALTILRYCG